MREPTGDPGYRDDYLGVSFVTAGFIIEHSKFHHSLLK